MIKKVVVRVKDRDKHIYEKRAKKHDFLKYWRPVKYYIKRKYNLSQAELEMILYLYDADVFTKEEFNEFASMLAWDKNRFKSMMDRGLIRKWRDGQRKVAHLYELTQQAKLICNQTYKKLLQEEHISEDPYQNDMMKKKSYTDKVYSNIIKKMNARKKGSS